MNSVTDARMNSIHSTPDGNLNGRELLLALCVHMAHHRGQAEIYLRIKGIKPPGYVF
ncbi:MAG TPA: DinB family protein [Bryobacteraceae bacterium]|nr:DinB family protein [Bryobacteraceae bacterium]